MFDIADRSVCKSQTKTRNNVAFLNISTLLNKIETDEKHSYLLDAGSTIHIDFYDIEEIRMDVLLMIESK
jgi:hypothetical protein